jgi:glutamate racemase
VSAQSAKIGVLDSGIGGLSVLQEIHRQLPSTPTLYIGDQAHLPYGPRSADEIYTFVEAMTRFLVEQGAAVVVLACNSASAGGLEQVRRAYPDIPFVGMEPAIKPSAEATRTGVVGVLTTRATANGALYQRVLARYAASTHVITQVTPELVTIAESGSQDSPEAEQIIRAYVEPLLEAHADQIVLACTHFPFLKDAIGKITGPEVTIVDPSAAVARQVARVWPTHLRPQAAENRYFTSGSVDQFRLMLNRLIGVDAPVTAVRWSGNHNCERMSVGSVDMLSDV